MKTMLLVLSLLGAVVTTASSIFAAKNKLFIEEGGKRTLLPSGYFSIGCTLIGLFITFSSGIVGYNNARLEAREKAEKEQVKRRAEDEKERNRQLAQILLENRENLARELQTGIINAHNKFLMDESVQQAQTREAQFTREIILSGQPLKSLDISWKFNELSGSFAAFMKERIEDARDYPVRNSDLFDASFGGRFAELQNLVSRHKLLYPFFNYLGTGREEGISNAPVLIQFSLDEPNSGIISFGRINRPLAGLKDNEAVESGFSGAVEFEEDLEVFARHDLPVSKLRTSSFPSLERISARQYQLSWQLDPSSLSNAMDFSSSKTFFPAKLPDHFRIILYYGIENLPFKGTNLAFHTVNTPLLMTQFERKSAYNKSMPYRNSTIRLCANGLKQVFKDYEVKMTGYFTLSETFDPPEMYSEVKIFECFALN
jgi:hypothetical protein